MRYAVTLHRRLRAVLFVALLWLMVAVLRQLDPSGGAAVLRIAANLATGWLIVALVARLISHPKDTWRLNAIVSSGAGLGLLAGQIAPSLLPFAFT